MEILIGECMGRSWFLHPAQEKHPTQRAINERGGLNMTKKGISRCP
jgi:hypothetical protein